MPKGPNKQFAPKRRQQDDETQKMTEQDLADAASVAAFDGSEPDSEAAAGLPDGLFEAAAGGEAELLEADADELLLQAEALDASDKEL
eukprot:tig00020629_g12363.t1